MLSLFLVAVSPVCNAFQTRVVRDDLLSEQLQAQHHVQLNITDASRRHSEFGNHDQPAGKLEDALKTDVGLEGEEAHTLAQTAEHNGLKKMASDLLETILNKMGKEQLKEVGARAYTCLQEIETQAKKVRSAS
jgi:hypothetical protein